MAPSCRPHNAQIAVDDAHQIIVAAALSNQAPDAQYFEPLLRRVVRNCDAVPACVTADTGYFSAANVQFADHLGTEPLISVGRLRRGGTPASPSRSLDPAPPTSPCVPPSNSRTAAPSTPAARPPSSPSSDRSEPAASDNCPSAASSRTDANGPSSPSFTTS
ncbi:MAG: transposase [Kofleriaceae bacterium]|nr:transposase [Kofleriaceae bacterium]